MRGSRTLSVSPPLRRTRSRLCTGRRISAACCGSAGSTGARSPRGIPLRALWRLWHRTHSLSGGGSPLGLPPPGMDSLRRAAGESQGRGGSGGGGGGAWEGCSPDHTYFFIHSPSLSPRLICPPHSSTYSPPSHSPPAVLAPTHAPIYPPTT